MKKITILLIMALSIAFSKMNAQSCWSEVWSDEFSGTSLNTANWSYDIGTGCPALCGWGNNEKEYYTSDADNIFVTGGNLNIRAEYSPNHAGSGYNFSSAKILSRNKQHWTYGKMEARIKLPAGVGVWPAFWMLPQNSPYGGWPTGGEIDIMEFRGDNTTRVEGTVHYGNAWPQNQYDGNHYTLTTGNFVDEFHLFTVEWSESQIRWYVDGNLYKTETKTPNSLNPTSNNDVNWPWDNDFFLILNVALGGWFTGNPTDLQVYGGNPNWAVTMQVDYVRVYTDLSGGALTGAIAGNTSVFPNQTAVQYSIPETVGASYVWTVPSGATISGQGTNSISVNWGTTAGFIAVSKTIGCGNAAYSLPVTFMPVTCGTMLEDFENSRFQNYGFRNGDFSPRVSNPALSVENSSSLCAQYVRNLSEQYDVLFVNSPGLGNADLIKNNNKQFMIDLYSNQAGRVVEITLESAAAAANNYPTGRHSVYRATTTKVNEWETLIFTRVAIPDASVTGTAVSALVLLFSPNTFTNSTFYFDNILLNEGPALPIISGNATVCNNQQSVVYTAASNADLTYSWTVPSGATINSGQGASSINVSFGTNSGNVSLVTTSISSGCSSASGSRAISNTVCTSISNQRSSNALTVYPNPASDKLSITIAGASLELPITVKIMESTGKVLIEEVYATSDELSIPLSSLKAGYYLVELKQGETTNIKGFIKQ